MPHPHNLLSYYINIYLYIYIYSVPFASRWDQTWLFFPCSHSVTVQITAPLIGVSPYSLFIYPLYDRTRGARAGLRSLKAQTHTNTDTRRERPRCLGYLESLVWAWPPRSQIPSTVRLHRGLPGGCDPTWGWALTAGGTCRGTVGGRGGLDGSSAGYSVFMA